MILTRCIYLGLIISNDLSGDADIQATMRLLYAETDMLWQHFYYCSADVKKQLFIAFFSTLQQHMSFTKFLLSTEY